MSYLLLTIRCKGFHSEFILNIFRHKYCGLWFVHLNVLSYLRFSQKYLQIFRCYFKLGHTPFCVQMRTEISPSYLHCRRVNTRAGTLIVATIYLQLIQNRYMFRSFTVLHCSHQHCVQPVARDVEVVGYL